MDLNITTQTNSSTAPPVPSSAPFLFGRTQSLNSSNFSLASNERVGGISSTSSSLNMNLLSTNTTDTPTLRERSHLMLDFNNFNPKPSLFNDTASILSSIFDGKIEKAQSFLSSAAQKNISSISQTPTPTSVIFPQNVTKAQEIFAEGFQKALNRLQNDPGVTISPGQMASPSTVKFMLSLAALTPSLLSPLESSSTSLLNNADGSKYPSPTESYPSDTSSSASSQMPKSIDSVASTSLNPPTINSFFQDRLKSMNQNDLFYPQTLPNNMEFPSFFPKTSPKSTGLHESILSANVQQNPLASRAQIVPPFDYGMQSQTLPPQDSFSASSSLLSTADSKLLLQNESQDVSTDRLKTNKKTKLTKNLMHRITESDMDEQERKRLERKRARNRAAASKCRQKKLERIAELEKEVSLERERGEKLEQQITRLQGTINELNHQIRLLKQ